MKVIGKMERPMEKAGLYMWMEMFTMEIGGMIKHTDMEYTKGMMEVDMKVIGRMTFNMGLGRRPGLTVINMKVITNLEIKKVKGNIYGKMEAGTQVIG